MTGYAEKCNIIIGGTYVLWVCKSGIIHEKKKYEELRDFLNYLNRGEVKKNSLTATIDKEVKRAREHLEWRTEYMTLQMRFDEIADEVRTEIIMQMIVNGMAVDMIARCCKVSEDKVREVEETMRK